MKIDQAYVKEKLGVEIYEIDDLKDRIVAPGICFGMAWTAAGG